MYFALFLLGVVTCLIGVGLLTTFAQVGFNIDIFAKSTDDRVPYSKYYEETSELRQKVMQLESKLKAQEERERISAKDRDALDRDKEAEADALRKRLGRIAELCPGYEKVLSPDFKGRLEIVSGVGRSQLPSKASAESDTNNVYYLFDQEAKRTVRSGLRAVIAENISIRELYDSVMDGRLRNAFNTELSIRKIDVTASIKSTENVYTVTPCSCTCPDFEKRGKPCKHMLFLAYSLGVLQAYPEHIDEAMEKLAKIPKRDRYGRYY